VTNQAEAKQSASFCAVGKYRPIFATDSVENEAFKADNNAAGAYLHCAWAKP
jgi:hypothetical protein